MKRAFVCATVALSALLWVTPHARADDDQLQKDLDALKGEWKVVWNIDADGKKAKPASNEIQSITFYPKKGKFSWPELNTQGTFTIDPSQNPATLVFSYVDPNDKIKYTSDFIYKFDDDKLMLAWQILRKSKSWDEKGMELVILKRKQ